MFCDSENIVVVPKISVYFIALDIRENGLVRDNVGFFLAVIKYSDQNRLRG